MPFQWTLNPYRGCTHGCHYCFARKYQTQLELGSGDDFAKVILIKVNFPTVLNQELSKISQNAQPEQTYQLVTIGTATDPYQSIEGRYQLTRQTLKTFLNHPTPVHLITKGPMVVRDKDVIVELSKYTEVTVCMSVPSVDEEGWKKLEPGTAHPLQRLRAVRALPGRWN
jgi:DNA repair photolyase